MAHKTICLHSDFTQQYCPWRPTFRESTVPAWLPSYVCIRGAVPGSTGSLSRGHCCRVLWCWAVYVVPSTIRKFLTGRSSVLSHNIFKRQHFSNLTMTLPKRLPPSLHHCLMVPPSLPPSLWKASVSGDHISFLPLQLKMHLLLGYLSFFQPHCRVPKVPSSLLLFFIWNLLSPHALCIGGSLVWVTGPSSALRQGNVPTQVHSFCFEDMFRISCSNGFVPSPGPLTTLSGFVVCPQKPEGWPADCLWEPERGWMKFVGAGWTSTLCIPIF